MTQGEGASLMCGRAGKTTLMRLGGLRVGARGGQLLCLGHMLLGMRGVVGGDLRLLGCRFGIARAMGLGSGQMARSGLLQVLTRLLVVLLQGLMGGGGFGGCQCHGVLSELIKGLQRGRFHRLQGHLVSSGVRGLYGAPPCLWVPHPPPFHAFPGR